MQDNEAEYTSVHDADIHVCIFPHLEDFIVLDVRDMAEPRYRVMSATELLTPDYYAEIEEEFSRMLRSGETAFLNLITLPQRLETFLRTRGLQRLHDLVDAGGEDADDVPRVSVFLCSGPVLSLDKEEMDAAMDAFFDDGPPDSFVRGYTQTFERLLDQERATIKQRQMEELRRAVLGRSNQFYTLWQDRPGASSN